MQLHPQHLKLEAVWFNDSPKRYVAQAYLEGPAWGVFDRRERRFVDDDLARLPLDAVAGETWADA